MSGPKLEIVGHRGFKAKYPENTLLCYDKAYEAGSDVIETDLQLTMDGKIVINHDVDTGRMWDQNLVIAESNLEDLMVLRNKMDPAISITTFKEALQWLKEHPKMKFMLDIKPTNSKVILVKTILEMREVVDDLDYWRERLIFGIWNVDWYKCGYITGTLKKFKIVAILPFSKRASRFIEYSNSLNDSDYKLYGVSLNFLNSWKPGFKENLLPYFKENNLSVYLWTVNSELDIQHVISSVPVYGIVVDDPINYVSIRDSYAKKSDPLVQPVLNGAQRLKVYLRLHLFELFEIIFSSKYATVPIVRGITLIQLTVILLRRLHCL